MQSCWSPDSLLRRAAGLNDSKHVPALWRDVHKQRTAEGAGEGGGEDVSKSSSGRLEKTVGRSDLTLQLIILITRHDAYSGFPPQSNARLISRRPAVPTAVCMWRRTRLLLTSGSNTDERFHRTWLRTCEQSSIFKPALMIILVMMSSHAPRPPEHVVPPGGIPSGLIRRHPSLSCGSCPRPQAETSPVHIPRGRVQRCPSVALNEASQFRVLSLL